MCSVIGSESICTGDALRVLRGQHPTPRFGLRSDDESHRTLFLRPNHRAIPRSGADERMGSQEQQLQTQRPALAGPLAPGVGEKLLMQVFAEAITGRIIVDALTVSGVMHAMHAMNTAQSSPSPSPSLQSSQSSQSLHSS